MSKINKTKGEPGQGVASRLVSMSKQLGVRGLFTGMSARLVMIGTLTAGQCTYIRLAIDPVLMIPLPVVLTTALFPTYSVRRFSSSPSPTLTFS